MLQWGRQERHTRVDNCATCARTGAVVSLTNWAGVPTITGLNVTVQLPTSAGVLRSNLVRGLCSCCDAVFDGAAGALS